MPKQSLKEGLLRNGTWLIADIFLFLAYVMLLPHLSAFFSKQSYYKGGVVVLMYFVFCASVVLIRKLPGAGSEKSDYSRGWLAFFAITFGIFITYIIAESAGLFTKLDSFQGSIEGRGALLILVGFLLWLVLAFLYMAVVLVKIKPFTFRSSSGTLVVEFLSILGVNFMVFMLTAFWNSYFSGIEPYEDLAIGGKILIFLFTYIFFLLFFAPPRMLFVLKKSNGFIWLTFLLQTAYFVWDSLSRLAW